MPVGYHKSCVALAATFLLSVLSTNEAGAETAAPPPDAEGVAGSGIEQGSGAITTRSDVTMSVESLPGTSALRLGAIGEAVGAQMTAIRTCYVDVAAQRPITTGTLRVRVNVPQRGAARLEIANDEVEDRELTQCVLRALRSASYANVRGPAGGMIVVQFANTAAQGARLVASQRRRTTIQVQVVNGQPQATTQTPGGEVSLGVIGTGSTSPEAVAALSRAAQARSGALLDCRRRAGRRGQNPEGEVVLSLRVPPRGNAAGRRISTTVADPTASQCLIRALRAAVRGDSDAAGAYRVTVRYAPR